MSTDTKQDKEINPEVDSLKIERNLLSQAYFQLKETTKKLEESERGLKEAERIGQIGNWSWNAETDTITWSPEYYRISGFDPKEKPPAYEEHLKMYVPTDAVRLDAAVKKSMQTGEPYELDLEQILPVGTRKWITARGEVVRDKDGKIIGLRGTAQNITVRKEAEIELVKVNRSLRVLSNTNQALIHINNNEKALLDKISQIVIETGGYHLMWIGFAEQDEAKTVRPVAEKGFGSEYLKITNISWADGEHGRGPTSLAIRTGKTQLARDILADPKISPWREAAAERGYKSSISLPLKSESQMIGALNIYSDETDAFCDKEIEILEELSDDLAFGLATLRLRKKVENRMKEIDQLKNKFIQIVSHQLRTPLGVIRWNLEALLGRERGEVSQEQMETLRGAYAADIEVISRINDLLTAMDIEEGRIVLSPDSVNMSELFQSVCEEALQPCILKNITYEIVASPAPIPVIQADGEKIREVVSRLIDNAITYTHDNGHITVKFFSENNQIWFEVSDTGMGIPVSERPHIFERFHRGWNATQMKPDASGLSLFIAKHYIEEHRGTMGFTSEEKKGSTFWFELPLS